MKALTVLTVLLLAPLAWAQDAKPPAGSRTEAEEPEKDEGVLMKAVELREKVRNMRRSVLGGGPAVERAEREALNFYRRKIQTTSSRIDELRTERDAKDAEYRLALDSTLEAESKEAGEAAARQAARLKTEIGNLDADIDDLVRQRDQLSAAVAAIRARIEHRKRLLAHFDANAETIETLPFLGEDVIGPDEAEAMAGDPFADDAFMADLLKRDPERARRMIFEHDPEKYWKLFPLTPPEGELRKAFPYPRPGGGGED